MILTSIRLLHQVLCSGGFMMMEMAGADQPSGHSDQPTLMSLILQYFTSIHINSQISTAQKLSTGGCSGSPRLAATDWALELRCHKGEIWNRSAGNYCTEAEQVDEWVNTQTLDKLQRTWFTNSTICRIDPNWSKLIQIVPFVQHSGSRLIGHWMFQFPIHCFLHSSASLCMFVEEGSDPELNFGDTCSSYIDGLASPLILQCLYQKNAAQRTMLYS